MSDTVTGWGSAAKVAGCSPTKIRRLVDRGELRAEKNGDGEWEMRVADLEALAATDAPGDQDADTVDEAGHEPPPEDAPAPAQEVDRGVHARAFELLDEGRTVGDLVVKFGLDPERAMLLARQWRDAEVASAPLQKLRDGLALASWLDEVGWTAEQIMEGYRKVHRWKSVMRTEHYTPDEALELLAVVAERIGDFAEAVEVLARLPDLDSLEARFQAAHEQLEAVRRGEEAARARVHQAHAELREMLKYAGWLRLAVALAQAVQKEDISLAPLRNALGHPAIGDPKVGASMAGAVPAEADTRARRALATWAAEQVPDLVVGTDEHRRAVARARDSSATRGMVLGAMMSGGLSRR